MSELGFAAQLAEDLSTEDLRLVLSVFLTDLQRLTGSLAAAAALGDDSAFRRAAHALAGAAGAVGAGDLESVCRVAMSSGAMSSGAMTSGATSAGAGSAGAGSPGGGSQGGGSAGGGSANLLADLGAAADTARAEVVRILSLLDARP